MKKRTFGRCCFCCQTLLRSNSSPYSRRSSLCLECRRMIAQTEVNKLCFSCFEQITSNNSGDECKEVSLCFRCFTKEIIEYLRGGTTLYDKYFDRFCSYDREEDSGDDDAIFEEDD